jgi:hypothetical protein
MKIRVQQDTSEEAANAIAHALAENFQDSVEVYRKGSGDRLVRATPERPTAGTAGGGARERQPQPEDLGPTDREAQLWAEIEDIEQGGSARTDSCSRTGSSRSLTQRTGFQPTDC